LSETSPFSLWIFNHDFVVAVQIKSPAAATFFVRLIRPLAPKPFVSLLREDGSKKLSMADEGAQVGSSPPAAVLNGGRLAVRRHTTDDAAAAPLEIAPSSPRFEAVGGDVVWQCDKLMERLKRHRREMNSAAAYTPPPLFRTPRPAQAPVQPEPSSSPQPSSQDIFLTLFALEGILRFLVVPD